MLPILPRYVCPALFAFVLLACRTLQPSDPAGIAADLVSAINSGDAHRIAALFDDDGTAYLPFGVSTLVVGKDHIEQALDQVLRGQTANLHTDNVRVDRVNGNVAIVTFGFATAQVSSRRTIVARYDGTRWKIVHLHASNVREAKSE